MINEVLKIKNEKILITGCMGSIGQEILREMLKRELAVVRIINVDVTKQFEFIMRKSIYINTTKRR